MRWQQLFADLEAQLALEHRARQDEHVADLTRAELAAVSLVDRLRAAVGAELRVHLRTGEVFHGRLSEVGASWLLVDDGRERLVPSAALVATEGGAQEGAQGGAAARQVAATPSEVESRLRLGHALRAVARDRARVAVAAGPLQVVGLVAGVGADHVEVLVLGAEGLRPTGRRLEVSLAALDHLTRLA